MENKPLIPREYEEIRRFAAQIEEVRQDFEELCGVLLVFKVLANLSNFEMENRGEFIRTFTMRSEARGRTLRGGHQPTFDYLLVLDVFDISDFED